METVGWVGGMSLAMCVIPQALQCWKQKHARGISAPMLWMWGLGEICMIIYVTPMGILPLILNYLVNFCLMLVIAWFKVFPQEI